MKRAGCFGAYLKSSLHVLDWAYACVAATLQKKQPALWKT